MISFRKVQVINLLLRVIRLIGDTDLYVYIKPLLGYAV